MGKKDLTKVCPDLSKKNNIKLKINFLCTFHLKIVKLFMVKKI